MRLFASLSKVEEQDDGSLKVFGIASSGARDEAGEIVQPAAMKAALPDYLRWGAIREMHQSKAAGTALEARVDEDGMTQLVAHVVDPGAVQKVKANVYKGFSIGGKVVSRDKDDPTIITAIRLAEISLVDRPCNPEAEINMWKADRLEPTASDARAETDRLAKAAIEAANAALERAKTAGLVRTVEAPPDASAAVAKLLAGMAETDRSLVRRGAEQAMQGEPTANLLKALPTSADGTIVALCDIIDDLRKRLARVESEPVPAKTAGSALALPRAVDKSQDAAGTAGRDQNSGGR